MRVLVLGAGFGGLELTTRLSDELGDDVDVVLIDKADGFVFGFSKLDVMFGRTRRRRGASTPTATSSSPACGSCRPTIRVDRPGGQARRDRRRHLRRRRARRRARRRPRPGGDAGPRRGRPRVLHGARRVRAARRAGRLRRRPGDRRRDLDAVQVPARAERDRAARCTTSSPSAGCATAPRSRWSCRCRCPIPPSPRRVGGAARRVRRARHRLASRASWCAGSTPTRKVALLADGGEMPYDLFLGVPDAPGARGGRGSRAWPSTAGSRSTR